MKKRLALILLAAGTGGLWFGVRYANSQTRPAHALGVIDGRLAPCPDRPNCVSTQADDLDQRISPISLDQSPEEAQRRLEAIVRSMPRSRIVSSQAGYFHAEFRSFLLGFVNDVEFFIDKSQRLIHFRSASRVGYSDLGANRRRMEEIRNQYTSA